MKDCDPTYEAWVEYRKPLPGGGTFTRLKAAPIPDPESQIARQAPRLVRVNGHTIAVKPPKGKA